LVGVSAETDIFRRRHIDKLAAIGEAFKQNTNEDIYSRFRSFQRRFWKPLNTRYKNFCSRAAE
jgi:hypothetical protein